MDDCANAQYPPITRELRKKLAEYKPTENGYRITTQTVGQTGYARLVELCDTIDAIHAQLERDYQRACDVNERQDMEYTQLKAERDSMAAALDAAQGEHDYAPESHYVMLPKDADGVPIHVGDVLVHVNNTNISTKPFEVRSLVWHGDSWTVCDRIGPTVKHSVLRHHGPDTWERIIEDAIGLGECCHSDVDMARLVARCKALAGDGTGECYEHH